MKQKIWMLASLMLVIVAAFGQARLVEKVTKTGNELVIPYEKYVLPNGLTVVISEDHSDPVVYTDVTYHVGSAREQIGKSGFAHFFEHMMFQGSDHVADGQHIKMVSEAGGIMNGSTTEDRTNYFETVPNNQLEKMLWLESDRMGFLLDAVSQKKFEIQRSTVKNERGQRIDNVPYGLAFQTISQTLYPYGHPYSWPVIGYLDDLNRSNVNDLKNFFLRWYGPNNATLTIVGDVKTSDALKMAEKYFGNIPTGPKVDKASFPLVTLDKDRYVSYTDNYAKLPLLAIVYPTVPNYNKDMAALQCLAQVLGQGRNSLLFQQMVKKQIAVQASAFASFYELAGQLVFPIIPTPGKSLADMEKTFRAALDSFEKNGGATNDDVAKFKGSQEAQLINGLQSVQGKGVQLAAFQTFTGNPNKIADLLKMYSSLTREDVMNAYNKYIKGKGAVILSVLPKGQEALVAAADNYRIDSSHYVAPNYGYEGLKYVKAKDNFDRNKVPAVGTNPVVKIPAFWKKNLTNGAKVIGTRNTEIPTVTFSLTIPGGHLASANDLSKAGLSAMFADMMTEDTKNYTAEQLSTELQKLGSSINVSTGIDGVTYTVQSLKKNFSKTLSLLQERLFNPKFTEQSFNRLKQQNLQILKQRKSQPAAIANEVFDKLNYGNSILGISENGTEETIKNISLQDIQNYYNNYMTSVGAKVVVVGDIIEQEVVPQLSFLNQLPRKKITLPKPEALASNVDKTKVYLVNIPKGAQTEFRIGYATGLPYDATGDYYKAFLTNFPLGGGFDSRLNLTLREGKGWTYGASSRFSGDEYSGNFQFSSGIRADATDSALAETMRIIKNYVQDGPTAEEVSFMKNAIGQSDARNYETGLQKAAFIRRILDYNLPGNYTQKQAEILKNITAEQLHALSKKYLNPDKINILLVGDKAQILPGIQKLGYEVVELDTEGNKVDGKKAF